MQDTILANNHERTATLFRARCEHLGPRTAHRAKRHCENSADYLPIYRCGKYRLCSPFGQTTDADLIHACEGCVFYRASLAENKQIHNDTQ